MRFLHSSASMVNQIRSRSSIATCKREAVSLITDHGYGGREAAWNWGLHAHRLRPWKQQMAPTVKAPFPARVVCTRSRKNCIV
jgi:hypothetical protein